MAYFKCGSDSGSTIEIDGVEVDGDLKLKKVVGDLRLPDTVNVGSGIVYYNGDLYNYYGNTLYKYDGVWKSINTAPYSLSKNQVCSMDDKLYAYMNKYIYYFDGTTWKSYKNAGSSCSKLFSHNNLLIMDASTSSGSDIRYLNGNSWTNIGEPGGYSWYAIYVGYKNAIHALGGSSAYNSSYRHYKYPLNGTVWESLSNINFDLEYGCAVEHNGKLHALGGQTPSYNYRPKANHYIYNGTSWTASKKLPMELVYGSATAGDKIYIANCSNQYIEDITNQCYKLGAEVYEKY